MLDRYPVYRDKSGCIVCPHDFLEDGDGVYEVLHISADGVEVVEVTLSPEGEEEIGMIEIGESWIKTREEVAKCEVW